MFKKFQLSIPDHIRALVLAWFISVTVEYTLNIGPLADLSSLSQMSLFRVIVFTAALFLLFTFLNRIFPAKVQRWVLFCAVFTMATVSLLQSYTLPFLICNILLISIFLIYAIKGWNDANIQSQCSPNGSAVWITVTAIAALLFCYFVSKWTVCRVKTFSTPSYDFGIFSQMFYNMKQTGLPLTTLERDGLLSHFKVHVSPIYYLLLPFYCIAPTQATLQVLQAALLASAVIPLWLLGKRHKLPPVIRALLCVLLLLYPCYSGGTSYDIHENAFLTPLILWLFYAFDSRKYPLVITFSILVLAVKEDSAVYVAVISLFYLLESLLAKKDKKRTIFSAIALLLSILWFLGATGYLAKYGDGVMTYRYDNFIYDGSGSLFTVIKSVILCPMKALFECMDKEKTEFILYTTVPLLGLQLITRRYERYILLIPYLLINLMSDYQYQHDIMFQYTFGSTACLFYMVLVNLADMNIFGLKVGIIAAAVLVSAIYFNSAVVPVARIYPEKYQANREFYEQVNNVLDTVPEGVSVAATTHYTTPLSQRSVLYDVRYTTPQTLLSCEYVVLSVNSENCYKKYALEGNDGFDNLVSLLLDEGYVLEAQLEGTVVIYRKG